MMRPGFSWWTIPALKEWVEDLLDEMDKRYEQRFRAQDQAVKAALGAADKATNKAEAAADKRFENTNEWRAALDDVTSKLPTRAEVDAAVGTQGAMTKELERRVGLLEKGEEGEKGHRAGTAEVVSYVFASISTIGLIIMVILRFVE